MIGTLSKRQRQPLETSSSSVFSQLKVAFHRDTEKNSRPVGQRVLCAARAKGGFTLVEMSVTIGVILVLIGAASLGIQPYLAYRDGRTAGEMLRSVKAAQLMYLSDYPSTPVTGLSPTLLLPYMPNGTWPVLPSVNSVVPTIDCTVFPPAAVLGGTPYDPSALTNDGLWDVGLY
jgi:prepilin-type N-terminal cleavage/methylation domain-containing protein